MAKFQQGKLGSPMGDALWHSTVLILGYGGIGEEIARRLQGFGCRVVAVSRHGPQGARLRDATVPLACHVAMDRLGEVLGEADAVVVAAPATPDNLGLVDAAMIARMKPGVRLVNIARGQVIDYHALLAGLRSGQIAGAGLDVFWQEPFDPQDPLLAENVIATPHIGGVAMTFSASSGPCRLLTVTPHIGGVTVSSLQGIAQAVAANINRLRSGQPLAACANAEALGRLAKTN